MSRNYYTILDIPRTSSSKATDSILVKSAYRKALLKYHPDKVLAGKVDRATTNFSDRDDIPTVDEITLAYQTLSDAKSRSRYDHELQLTLENEATAHDGSNQRRVGIETIDLDDMEYDEGKAIWTRECRCGMSGGFVLREDDLEKAADELGAGGSLEVLIGCSGCSLSLKVNFAITEET